MQLDGTKSLYRSIYAVEWRGKEGGGKKRRGDCNKRPTLQKLARAMTKMSIRGAYTMYTQNKKIGLGVTG
jgi:predicted Ser/Thr protein kinase